MGLRGIGRAWSPGIVFALCVGFALTAHGAPNGRPRTVQYLGSLSDHDPAAPTPGHEPWTPADVVDLLVARPQAAISLGRHDGLPPGTGDTAQRRRGADRIRVLAAAAGIDAAARLCVPLRVDVQRKLRPGHAQCDPLRHGGSCDWEGDMDGSLGEREAIVKTRGRVTGAAAETLVEAGAGWQPGAWAHRLVVVRPGSALEERRRITSNDAATLQVTPPWKTPPRAGDAYEIRGSFDPGWVMRVPAAAHAAAVQRFWSERRNVCGRTRRMPCAPPAEALDPLAPGNARGWRADVDRDAIAGLATSAGLPALFGTIRDADPSVAHLTDPYPSVDSVMMDVREPGYRDWRVRSLLYTMRDLGVEPGAPACVIVGYEPALLAHYDEAAEGPSRHRCALPDTHSWQAPLHVCSDTAHGGGPLAPTGYGPGEFEAGLNDLLRELLATLPEHGYTDVRLVTAEGDPLRGRPWTALAADLRFDARVDGELDAARAPRLAAIAGAATAARAASGGGAAGKPVAATTRGWQSVFAQRSTRSSTPQGKPSRPVSTPTTSNGSSASNGSHGSNGSSSPSWSIGSPSMPKGGKRESPVVAQNWNQKPASSQPKGVPATPVISPPPAQPAPPLASPPIPPAATPPDTTGNHPNEPTGMVARWPSNPMDSLPPTEKPDRYGFKCWPDQCRTLSIVHDGGSSGRNSNVLRVTYPRGHPGGGAPSRFLAGNDFGGKRRLYTSVQMYLSPNWNNGGNGGTKFFFMRASADGVQNHYVNLAGDLTAPFTTGVFLQTPDGRGNRNMPVGPVPVGRWFRFELYLQMNDPGEPNGIARLWIDEELKLERADIRWMGALPEGRSLRDVSWSYLWVDPTYGGGSNPVPEEMYFQLDDWYTSVGN